MEKRERERERKRERGRERSKRERERTESERDRGGKKICTGAGLTKTHTPSPIVAAGVQGDIIYQWTNAGPRMLLLK